jgi:formate dehydrogenase alpha subunit
MRLSRSRILFQDDNPFFVRDHQYCILCAKCVRVCDEVVGANAIDLVGRGFTSHVATPFDGPMINSSCVFCGNCVQVCPTAALLPVSHLGKGREWELESLRKVSYAAARERNGGETLEGWSRFSMR